eukprot:4633540-Ditylum_brightwellii.AAC.1
MNDHLEQFLPRQQQNSSRETGGGQTDGHPGKCSTQVLSLDTLKQGQKGRQDATSATGNWKQILRNKRGQEADVPSLTENQTCKKVAKFCLLYGRGKHTINKCEVLRKQVKGLQSEKEKNTQSGLANGNGCQMYYSRQELNTIIGKSIKAALKKECKDHAQQEKHNTIGKFDVLSLSLSHDNDISHT